MIGRGQPAAFPRFDQCHAHPGSCAVSNSLPRLGHFAASDFNLQLLGTYNPTFSILAWILQES